MIRVVFLTLGVCLLVLTTLQTTYLGIKNYLRYRSFHKEASAIRSELDHLTIQTHQFSEMLSRSQHPSFWELEAKQVLGLSYKTETVYKLYFER